MSDNECMCCPKPTVTGSCGCNGFKWQDLTLSLKECHLCNRWFRSSCWQWFVVEPNNTPISVCYPCAYENFDKPESDFELSWQWKTHSWYE